MATAKAARLQGGEHSGDQLGRLQLVTGLPRRRPLAHGAYVLAHAAERAVAQLLAQLRRLAVCAHAYCQ